MDKVVFENAKSILLSYDGITDIDHKIICENIDAVKFCYKNKEFYIIVDIEPQEMPMVCTSYQQDLVIILLVPIMPVRQSPAFLIIAITAQLRTNCFNLRKQYCHNAYIPDAYPLRDNNYHEDIKAYLFAPSEFLWHRPKGVH